MHIPFPVLNLPAYPFKLTQSENQIYIYCELRKKRLVLTPEEWVRQHFVQYLIHQLEVPKSLIILEAGVKYNTLQKRTDILAASPEGNIILLVECKAPTIKLTQSVFYQAATYNHRHKASWLALTNGIQHVFAQVNHQRQSIVHYAHLPHYSQMCQSV